MCFYGILPIFAFQLNETDMLAMIFAAGKGTRLRPLTDERPKALVEVDGRTLLEIQMERLYRAGCRRVVVNVHHFADMMVDWLQKVNWLGLQVLVSDERARLLNTGGGLKQAGRLMDMLHEAQPLLVHNVDVLDNADLQGFYRSCHDVDACLLVSERDTQRYLLFDENNRLMGWENRVTREVKSPYAGLQPTDCRRLAFAGMHVVGQGVFREMERWPDEFSIIDFYVQSCRRLRIKGVVQPDLRMLDVGKPETLAVAGDFLKELAPKE